MRKISLSATNERAWNLYWDSRSSAGDLLLRLQMIKLTEEEADDLAIRIRILASEVLALEKQNEKDQAAQAKKGK